MLAERACAAVLAGDAYGPARAFLARAGAIARADIELAMARANGGGDGKAARAVFTRKFAHRGGRASRGPARERYRLEQIGLARAVLADENDRARVEVETRGRIVAKVGELQRADRKRRCGRAWPSVSGSNSMSCSFVLAVIPASASARRGSTHPSRRAPWSVSRDRRIGTRPSRSRAAARCRAGSGR